MATNYPYVSTQGALVKAFDQFRKTFPTTLDAEVLQKFSIAPANESYVVNTFRFLGLIDDEGKRIDAATDFFYGDDAKFSAGLDEIVSRAYEPLIADHGAEVWNESRETLTTWFRVTDKTSELVGGRQAQTFLTLAALAGHGEVKRTASKTSSPPTGRNNPAAKKSSDTATRTARVQPEVKLPNVHASADTPSGLGLTVRVEINLPANGSPDTYDAIFASIRKHLIDRA